MTTDDLLTPIEYRIDQLAQAKYGSEDHRLMVFAFAEAFETMLPNWDKPSRAPAWAARIARRFGEGKPIRWCDVRRARNLLLRIEGTVPFHVEPKANSLVQAAYECLNVISNGRNGRSTLSALQDVESALKFVPIQASPGTSLARACITNLDAEGAIIDAFNAQLLAKL